MTHYKAVAHILWELPFSLRLPPAAFLIWEPSEGVALIDPRPGVGDLMWCRKSSLLKAEALYPNLGPTNDHIFQENDYLITSLLSSGKELTTAKLVHGPDGGFIEVRPYTLINIFLCLRQRSEFSSSATIERAMASFNNLLESYRFVTMDVFARPLREGKDSYCTVVSVADLPLDTQDFEAIEILKKIDKLAFGHIIGQNRSHTIGLNTLEDLFPGEELPKEHMGILLKLSATKNRVELHHQLILSAIRRLKRGEHSLAVLDAESAFEVFVAMLIVEHLQRKGLGTKDIEDSMLLPKASLHTLQRRLEDIDRIAAPSKFLYSQDESAWRSLCYRLRHRVVHEGLRVVSFDDAKKAIVSALHAISAIENMSPLFERPLSWSGASLDLQHVQDTAGRISRLFET